MRERGEMEGQGGREGVCVREGGGREGSTVSEGSGEGDRRGGAWRDCVLPESGRRERYSK